MTAILSNLIYLFKTKYFPIIPKPLRHSWDIPLPNVIHRTLDTNFIESFKEVLIIGDVHGCFDEMIDMLEQAGPNVLKIFVGDLVNKGNKSKQVLQYLTTKGSKDCIAVRGNHDEVVIREYFNYIDDKYSLVDKNKWIADLEQSHIQYLSSLPYTITLTPLNALIVHAGIIPGIELFNNRPEDMVTMRNIIFTDYFEEDGLKPTDNDQEGVPWASIWTGPQHVYFGHDAKRKLQEYPFATGLDTGCVYGGELTGLFIKGKRKGSYIVIRNKGYKHPISK